MEEAIITYLTSIKNELNQSGRQRKNLKIRSVLSQIGCQRRSQSLIDKFNKSLIELGLKIEPEFDIYLHCDQKVSIYLNKASTIKVNPTSMVVEKAGIYSFETLQVEHDFFFYLFDFGSNQEYEMFQACLDSNKPIGIFLVPAKEDFFSDVVAKILTYEAIRKKQYKGVTAQLITSHAEFGNSTQLNEGPEAAAIKYQEQLSSSTILHFSQSKMTNVILGSTSSELIDSERFDEKFNQLALYTNKYYSDQFFILFHCPSESEIAAHQKEDMLGYLVDEVAKKLPFVFTLRCKYPNDASVPSNIRKSIQNHFRLLLEAPKHFSDEEDLSIIDYFVELQKVQTQAEAQLFIRMKPKYFRTLVYGFESDEHIYLKYFAIRTLEAQGYDLSQIKCEVTVDSGTDESNSSEIQLEINRRPDVYVENKVIVEIETLRSKTSGDNVFLDLIQDILIKIDGWPNKLNDFWLVLPGFEIARSYYQLKKTKEILEAELIEKYTKLIKLSIMTPDYENHQLIPVSFDLINYPYFELKQGGSIPLWQKHYATSNAPLR